MIEGVIIKELKQFIDDRGRVMHMLRCDNPMFEKFGEIYFSEVFPGAVKAWKRHKLMTQLLTVPVGKIRLAIYDDREESMTKGEVMAIDICKEDYKLVKVPPELWYGFKCISNHPALIANCPDFPHDPEESERKQFNDSYIPYKWQV